MLRDRCLCTKSVLQCRHLAIQKKKTKTQCQILLSDLGQQVDLLLRNHSGIDLIIYLFFGTCQNIFCQAIKCKQDGELRGVVLAVLEISLSLG